MIALRHTAKNWTLSSYQLAEANEVHIAATDDHPNALALNGQTSMADRRQAQVRGQRGRLNQQVLGVTDLVSVLDGDETTKQAFTGCPVDGNVELWTMAGGSHVPPLTENFAVDIIDWLYAHPKV